MVSIIRVSNFDLCSRSWKRLRREVAANGAADTAVAHFHDFLVRGDQQVVIDPDFAEFVHDDRDASAVIGSQDPVEKRGFASPEKAGENGHRNAVVVTIAFVGARFRRALISDF